MFAWNVEPWALSVPVAHAADAAAGAEPADVDVPGAAEVEAADLVAAGAAADVEADELDLVLLSLVPHAAAASKAPAVSRVAAMREVLKG
jgi:hypothetical protein